MTDEQLIADYLAKNGVTKIPTGESGLGGYVWCPKKNRLLLKDEERRENWNMSLFFARNKNIERMQRERDIRLGHALEMFQAGASKENVASALGVSVSAVIKYAQHLRNEGKLPPANSARKSQDLDRIFAEGFDPSKSIAANARDLGMAETSIKRRMGRAVA